MEKEKRTERFNMKIQPSLKAAAEKKAESLGYSLSRYVEVVLKNELKKKGKEKMENIYEKYKGMKIIYCEEMRYDSREWRHTGLDAVDKDGQLWGIFESPDGTETALMR